MKKENKKRWITNLVSLLVFAGATTTAVLVTMDLYGNYKYNQQLKANKEQIKNELENMEDDRNNESYYEIYVKDNIIVYDDDIVIEFPNK